MSASDQGHEKKFPQNKNKDSELILPNFPEYEWYVDFLTSIVSYTVSL